MVCRCFCISIKGSARASRGVYSQEVDINNSANGVAGKQASIEFFTPTPGPGNTHTHTQIHTNTQKHKHTHTHTHTHTHLSDSITSLQRPPGNSRKQLTPRKFTKTAGTGESRRMGCKSCVSSAWCCPRAWAFWLRQQLQQCLTASGGDSHSPGAGVCRKLCPRRL
jgi:hypothetical protein